MIDKRTQCAIGVAIVGCLAVAGPTCAASEADGTAGEALVAAAVAYHDPAHAWSGGAFRLTLESSRPDGSRYQTALEIDNRVGTFRARQERPKVLIEAEIGPGEICVLRLDGSSEIDPEPAEGLGLDCDRWRRMRDYYLYMWGLPMKLHDAGAIVGSEVTSTSFAQRPVREVRITYDESVGTDTWYFSFDPETSRARGYRFYHDEAANDGEYIVLEGEVDAGGVRFPRRQTWYTNADHRLLGSDELIAAERLD